MKREIIDGNTACAKASYKLSEMSFIYPITPSSPMAEYCDEMATKKEKNIFGNVMDITEMQSEGGAIGALHGAILSGSLATTFTSSQGLLLMIPNMYKIAGEMLPCVLNVASRSVASHSLNIFCDHSDIMSVRQTGFAMLGSSNPQESYHFAVASYISSLKSRVPFLHFFDGFRTSHQISTVNTFDDDELKSIYPFDKLQEFKSRALSPNNPKQYGTSESQDIFFQGREKSNLIYQNLPNIVEETLDKINKLCKKNYHIMEYYGSANAKYVICSMASSCDTIKDYITHSKDDEIGLVKINLYRPFDVNYFLNLLPKSVEKIAVLDRTKEQGSVGEPLYLDVSNAIFENKKQIEVVGGRYGLGGKEFAPNMVKAIFNNLKSTDTKNHFVVGIDDDLSKSSLNFDKDYTFDTDSQNFLFYGIGSDGTVSSAKNIAKIFGDSDNFVQAYFMYDSKKSGGLTRSFVSISNKEINSPYISNQNDIVVCNNPTYLTRCNVSKQIRQNGVLLVNSKFTKTNEIANYVLNDIKIELTKKNITLYSIDANKIARENNLEGKISNIMQMAFFCVSNILDYDIAKEKTINTIKKSLAKKGEKVISQNIDAISDIKSQIVKIDIDKNWANLKQEKVALIHNEYVDNYLRPILDLNGDELPVSKVNLFGENTVGTSKFEKRNVSNFVPLWNSEKCAQCGKCTFVCPHAVLRAKLLSDKDIENAPKTLSCKKSTLNKELNFHLEVSPADCLACGLCANICPTKAISLVEKEKVFDAECANYEYTKDIESQIPNIATSTLKTQFMKPYFEFSGACAGCGETPYIKLLTQLFGKQLVIANATGCSSIYGGSSPSCPYTSDKNGFGPAWANSLFEDNAEFGLGIEKSHKNKRQNFKLFVENNIEMFGNDLKQLLIEWLNNFDSYEICEQIYLKLKSFNFANNDYENCLSNNLDMITPKSIWLVGGDGWAYDIDFGGLDHVLASGENINILVLDTELYSNTGGQKSKSTPRGAMTKFASDGKKTAKKNLVLSALQYKNVYVAEVCLGADMNQTLKAFVEAQKYDGVSIIVAYAPCIAHGIDMSKNLQTQLDAVRCGYWHLFRYNPALLNENKNPMQIDFEQKTGSQYDLFENHLLRERRFANLFEKNNDKLIFEQAKNDKDEFYKTLKNIKEMYEKNSEK